MSSNPQLSAGFRCRLIPVEANLDNALSKMAHLKQLRQPKVVAEAGGVVQLWAEKKKMCEINTWLMDRAAEGQK